jgi:FMN phosphatase YigB (HAD superfamily)
MKTRNSRLSVVFFDLGNTLVLSGQRRWVSGAQAVLSRLRQENIRLGIISNTGDLARQALMEHLPAEFSFDDFEADLVLLSSEVSLKKPDIRIFLKAMERAAVPPSECLFCTEDFRDPVVAQLAGMRSIRVRPSPGDDLEQLVALLEMEGLI